MRQAFLFAVVFQDGCKVTLVKSDLIDPDGNHLRIGERNSKA